MRKVSTSVAALILFSLLVCGVLWYPYETAPIPSWKLQVLDSAGKPVSGVTAHEEWLDPINEGITIAGSRDTDRSGFVEFPRRTRHSRLALGSSVNAPSAHIIVCIGGEYGDVFFDEAHATMINEMHLREVGCPYG